VGVSYSLDARVPAPLATSTTIIMHIFSCVVSVAESWGEVCSPFSSEYMLLHKLDASRTGYAHTAASHEWPFADRFVPPDLTLIREPARYSDAARNYFRRPAQVSRRGNESSHGTGLISYSILNVKRIDICFRSALPPHMTNRGRYHE
jgi:hypothetical protein